MFLLGSAYPLGKFGLNASMNPIFFGALRMGFVFLCLLPFCKIIIPKKKPKQICRHRKIRYWESFEMSFDQVSRAYGLFLRGKRPFKVCTSAASRIQSLNFVQPSVFPVPFCFLTFDIVSFPQ